MTLLNQSRPRTYKRERRRLLETASMLAPHSKEYKEVMDRIEQLDKIKKRSSEKIKVVIPACATVVSVVGIYVIQQFAGVIVPKALDVLASRSSQNPNEKD